MLKFDLNAISDFTMYLENEKIITETPEGRTDYSAEDWKRAYTEFFVAVGTYLVEREDWAFGYDFSKVQSGGYDTETDTLGKMPNFENSDGSSNAILKDFEDIKKTAYSRAYETVVKPEKTKPKRLPENKQYDAIVEQMAYTAMQRVWYLYLEKKLTVEQARDESILVFREYRRLRILLLSMEQYENQTFKAYQRQLDIRKRTAGLYAHLINNVSNMTDAQLIDNLIDIISAQNGENVSGDVIRKKVERKRISKLESDNPDLSLAI